jgi:hypothetical protein
MATLADVIQALGKLAAMYPHGPELTETHFEAYHTILADVPPDVLEAAAISLGSRNKFFPAASELRAEAFSLVERADGEPCAYLAWDEVCRAISKHGHREKPEWSQPIIGVALRTIGGYGNVCLSTNHTADRARFVDAYDRLVSRARL